MNITYIRGSLPWQLPRRDENDMWRDWFGFLFVVGGSAGILAALVIVLSFLIAVKVGWI